MTRHKWNLHWSLAVVLALAIGCGYWGLAGGCATPGDGGGNGDEPEEIVVSESTCEPAEEEGGEFEVLVQAVSSEGRQLSFTKHVVTPPGGDAGFQTETEVTADGELVMSMITSNGPTRAEVQIEYGSLVPGMSSASAVVENGVLTGMVNGRAIVSFPVDSETDPTALNVEFEDGAPPPEHGMDADLEAALTELFEAATVAAEECPAPRGNDVEKVIMGRQLKNTGHYSETGLFETGDCAICWGECAAEAVGCAAAVGGGCVATLFGYVACVVVGEIACAVAEGYCFDDCYDPGEGCCPVFCHSIYTCCFADETCMDPDTGRCCGPGETPCGGKYCCEGTEVCINDSQLQDVECCEPQNICGDYLKTCCNPTDACIPDHQLCCPVGNAPCFDHCCETGQACVNVTTCCDVENICGDRCCADEEVCHAGVCCLPHLVCGSVCCDDLDYGCIPELSLCCGFDQDVCGNTCCPIGESCVGGTTCCPDARICGDQCCPEGNGCDPQTSQCTPCPNPTDIPCLVGGCCPAGKVCQDVEGICCDPGEICCNALCSGGCRPISECIN